MKLKTLAIGVCCINSFMLTTLVQAQKSGEWCDEIQKFAEDFNDSQERKMTFSSNWLFYKSCKRTIDDSQSRHLCAYMLQHASSEFVWINIKRTLQCFNKEVDGKIEPDNGEKRGNFVLPNIFHPDSHTHFLIEETSAQLSRAGEVWLEKRTCASAQRASQSQNSPAQ